MSQPNILLVEPTLDLSIIIVNWNTRALLTKCLESIIASSGLRMVCKSDIIDSENDAQITTEVWVVDNVSTDGSAQMVREQFSWVHLIENQENIGFAGANNQAIRHSNGRAVLLLNPDTEIKPGALQTMIEFLETHPTVGAVGPHTLNPDLTLQESTYPLPTLAREAWRLFHLDKFRPFGIYPMREWDQTEPRDVDVLLGACILLRRIVIDKVGPMDPSFFMYSEEVDLCYRIQKGGWRLFWVPAAKIIHYGGQSTQQVRAKMFLQLYRSKLHFFRKHYGWLAVQLYKLVILLAALSRIAAGPFAWFGHRDMRQRRLELAAAYLQLLKALPGY